MAPKLLKSRKGSAPPTTQQPDPYDIDDLDLESPTEKPGLKRVSQKLSPKLVLKELIGSSINASAGEDPYCLDDFELDSSPPVVKKRKNSDMLKKMMKQKVEKEQRLHDAREALQQEAAEDSGGHGDSEDEEPPITSSQEAVQERMKQMTEDSNSKLETQPPLQARVLQHAAVADFKLSLEAALPPAVAAVKPPELPAGNEEDSECYHPRNLSEAMLLNGSLIRYCLRTGGCPEVIAKQLFRAMYMHQDESVCSSAFQGLSAILGSAGADMRLGSSYGAAIAWRSTLHCSKSAADSCHMEWLPGEADFEEALQAVGVPLASGKSTSSKKRKAGSQAEATADVEGTLESLADPAAVHRLCLLLRMLTCRCTYGAAPALASTADLLLALLQLYADPAASAYYPDLKVATEALIQETDPSSWDDVKGHVAKKIHGLLPSHMCTVYVLQQLPVESARGCQLQSQAALMSLASTLKKRLPQSCSPEVETVLHVLGDGAELGKAARKPNKPDFWAIASGLRMADMLLWKPAVSCGGGAAYSLSPPPATGYSRHRPSVEDTDRWLADHSSIHPSASTMCLTSPVRPPAEISLSLQSEDGAEETTRQLQEWGNFMQKLQKYVRATSPDESENRLRLLLAELASYYDYISRQHQLL